MRLWVQKYGGTSVGSPERIQAVADRIVRARHQGISLVVVVSAMGHTTDELIELAHEVSKNPPHREMDMLLTAGERISMALLSMALWDRKVNAISLTGSQTGIITDGSHRRAKIRRILGDRVRAAISENRVVIVAGFQGVSETKEITTLGRGGSDTSAVALAAALGAEGCEIYTDVDGVYSADPRVVAGARMWKQIPHDLMVELATRGAGVLHPRSVELAKQFGVRLRVRSSLNDGEGTEIVSKEQTKQGAPGMEDFRIVGVTADQGKALVRITLRRPTALSAVLDLARDQGLSLVAPQFLENQVVFFADREAEMDWKKALDSLVVQEFAARFEILPSQVPVTVVGDRFSQDGAAIGAVMETLAQSQISVTMGSASALALTVAVPEHRADDAVRALHEKFIESSVESKDGERS